MYCKNCGKDIDDRAVVCVHCGVATDNSSNPVGKSEYKPISGFVLSFFFGLIGAIVSLVQFLRAKKENGQGGFALAGIIIGVVSWVLSLYLYYTMGIFDMFFKLII